MQANHLVANNIWTNKPAVNGKTPYWKFSADQITAFNNQINHWRTLTYVAFSRLATNKRDNNTALYPFWALCSNMYSCTYKNTGTLTLRQIADSIIKAHAADVKRLITRIVLIRFIDDTDNANATRAHVHYSAVIQPSYYSYHIQTGPNKGDCIQGSYEPLYLQDHDVNRLKRFPEFEGLRCDVNQGTVNNTTILEPQLNVSEEAVTQAFTRIQAFDSVLRAIQFVNSLDAQLRHQVAKLVDQAVEQEAELPIGKRGKIEEKPSKGDKKRKQ